jgi:hypothetical protein
MNRWLETPPSAFDVRRDGMALAALSIFAIAIQLPIYDRWLSLLDEGAIAQIADQINHGLLPYRDGVHVAFPGVFYLTAGLFEIFGPSLVVCRYFMVGLFIAFICVFYLLARTVTSRGAAFGTGLLAVSYRVWAFPHFQMINYSSLVILPLMIGVAILALDVAHPRRSLPPLAGAAMGVGIAFRQDLAGIALAVLSIFVLVTGHSRGSTWRVAFWRAIGFGAAGLSVPIAIVLAFASVGLAGELLHQTLWYPLVAQPYWTPISFGGFYAGFPPLWPPWEQAEAIRDTGFFSYFPGLVLDLYLKDILKSWVFRETVLPELFVRAVYTLPYALLAILILHEVKRTARNREPSGEPAGASVRAGHLRLLIAFGVAALLSFNRPRDWIHLMVLYTPTLLLLGPLVELLAGSAPTRRRRLVLASGAAGAGIALIVSFALAIEAHRRYGTPLAAPRAGLFVDENCAAVINPLVARLMPEAGGDPAPLAALPAQPVLNFLTGRPLATRFLTLLPNKEYPDRDEQVVRDLNRDPRTEIVYSIRHIPFAPLPQDFIPGVFAKLVAHYQLGTGRSEIFSGTNPDGLLLVHLKRREERHEDVLYDFAEHLDQAVISRFDDAGKSGGGAPPDDTIRRIDTWPFESPVVTIAPLVSPGARSLTYAVEAGTEARLRFGVAMNPDRWSSFFARSLHFVVRIDETVVFEDTIEPHRNFDDRGWKWADVPVAPGRHSVEFEVSTDNRFGTDLGIAGFARPRLVASGSPHEP